MTALSLRIKSREGQHVISDLGSGSSICSLKQRVSQLTHIPVYALRLLQGFPPRPLDIADEQQTLAALRLTAGDVLIAEEEQQVSEEEANRRNEEIQERLQGGAPAPQRGPVCSAVPDGILMRRVVPANNSCLFTSIDFVVQQRDAVHLDSAKPMRKIIAAIVADDPETYSNAFLGKSNQFYRKWILSKETWGGAIEISILSQHYSVEIDVVDTQTGRIDRFGEDRFYAHRVLLIYDGIHYDPLVLEPAVGDGRPQTMFPTSDEGLLGQALQLAAEAKAARQYTDVVRFSLRCLVCQTALRGQTEAQAHAKTTGHINFGEF